MKINIFYLIGLLAIMFITSCSDGQDYRSYEGEYGTETTKLADPVLNIESQVVSFIFGTDSYPVDFNLVNGEKAVTTINIYNTFNDAASGESSNEVLLRSVAVDGSVSRDTFSEPFTYAELKEGLTLAGSPLPDDETQIGTGSTWNLRYEGVTSTGDVQFAGSTIIGVLHRYAGLYEVIESAYWRIGSDSGPWDGETRFIGSPNATTFSYNDAWGPFGWVGNSFTFTIDEGSGEVVVPLLNSDGSLANGGPLFSGNRAVGCHTEPGFFTSLSVPCEESNVFTEDPDGKHILKMHYGYFTDGSGAREFYEVLRKI